MRAALIGCGAVGAGFDVAAGSRPGARRTHGAALRDRQDVDLVALCDPDEGRRLAAAKAFRAAGVFADAEEMLASVRPDLVSIATPPESHVRLVEAALAAGVRGLWLEKPLGRSSREAERIAAAVAAAGARAVLNHPRRWARTTAALKARVEDGAFGAPSSLRGLYDKGLANNGGHMIDLMMALFGPPSHVAPGRHVPDDRIEDPTQEAALTFMDGALAARLDARDHRGLTLFELDVQFERGRALLTERGAVLTFIEGAAAGGYELPRTVARMEAGLDGAFEAALEDLLSAMRDPAHRTACGPEDGAAVWRVVEAIRRPFSGR